jgi:small GTP-binding protein
MRIDWSSALDSADKVILLGESRVGKTSIITRQVSGYLPDVQRPTVGCVHSRVVIRAPAGAVAMHVWDTSGQELYRSLVPLYVRGARLAIVVFDLTEHGSFEALPSWLGVVADALPADTPVLLVGNKLDLAERRAVPDSEIEAFADPRRLPAFLTSARTGEGILALFEGAARLILAAPVPAELREFRQAVTHTRRTRCCQP